MDSDAQAVLGAHAAFGPRPLVTLAPSEARLQPTLADQDRDTFASALVPGVTSRDVMIAGAAGPIPARIYTPEGERRHYDGVMHEFFGMPAVVEKAASAHEYAAERLQAAFGTVMAAAR